ncbi:MAG: hypothetical protein NWF00_08620 [Candidatus Bathyarchaeota archaeon]|nr:hypothetical protein [Candidatus Bathyarchaeota archaeon]
MNKNLTSKRKRNAKTSISKVCKSRVSIISILLLSALVVVSLSLSAVASSSVPTTQLPESKPHFNLDVAYSFVGKGPNATCTGINGSLLSPKSLYPSAVYFNVTRSPNSDNVSCDALIEIYQVKIASDRGTAENFAYFDGTNYEPSFSQAELTTLTDHIYDLVDLSTVDGVSGNFCFNWTLNESVLSQKVGSVGVYNNYNNGVGLWSAGQPNTISVTVHRLGYITMTDGVISVIPDDTIASLTQVQLQNYGASFLTNKIVPADQLSQINLFNPIR